MKILELEKASKPLADYAADLDLDSLLITSNNKPVAAGSFDHDGSCISNLVRLLEEFNALTPQLCDPGVEIRNAQRKMIHQMSACADQRTIARIHV